MCVRAQYLQDFKLMEARQSLWVDESKVITSQTSMERERYFISARQKNNNKKKVILMESWRRGVKGSECKVVSGKEHRESN